MKVIKRTGKLEDFNPIKIYKAIMMAAVSAEVEDFEGEAEKIVADVERYCDELNKDTIHIEDIQDIIELDLYYICNSPEVAKKFILYREKRNQERQKALKYKEIVKNRAQYPEESNTKQNANVDEKSFSGRMYEASEALWKEVALDDFMPSDIAELHKKGELWLHDCSRIAIGQSNCLQIDFDHIFKHGLITRQSHLRPPSRFASACQQIAVIMQIVSQSLYGGVAAPYLDRTLKPFVEKSRQRIKSKYPNLTQEMQDQILKDEIVQGAEALIANLSSLQSRSGSQLPFSSLCIGGDTHPDAMLITEAILNAMIDGVGPNHITPPFPILCFQVGKGINRNPEDVGYKNYQLAIKCATKRLTPNFVNLDVSTAHSISDPDTWLNTMGCRTQLGYDRFRPENPYCRVGRGNLAPHTIIPVAAAIRNGICLGKRKEPDIDGFIKEFQYLLEQAEKSLIIRSDLIFKQKMNAAYEMYVNHVWKADYEYDSNATVYPVLKHGTFVIGVLGWAETLIALFGKNQYQSKEAADFLMKMTDMINDFCKQASERNNLNIASYATPAENLSFTAMKKLQNIFGDKIKDVTDHEYLTNSYHIPVTQEVDIFDKIKLEAKYAKHYTGGNIVYVEFDSTAIENTKAIEQIINYAMEQDIPYFALNFPLDYCADCGYTDEICEDYCPYCGSDKIIRLRRITGYISAGDYHSSVNNGKQSEIDNRVKHTNGVEIQI